RAPPAAGTAAFAAAAGTATAFAAPLPAAPAALAASALGRRRRGGLLALRVRVRAEVGLPDDLAVEDPDLHAAGALDGVGRGLRVVDVGAEGVERHAALHVLLGPAHLGAAEAAGELDPDALGAHAHGGPQGLLHGAAERDAALELLRDILRHEGGVELGPLDLVDVDLDVLVRQLPELLAELLHLGAAAADDDARAGGVEREDHAPRRPLDHDAAEAGALEAGVEVAPDLLVLDELVGEGAVGVPVGVPAADDAEAEAHRVRFLSHRIVGLAVREGRSPG